MSLMEGVARETIPTDHAVDALVVSGECSFGEVACATTEGLYCAQPWTNLSVVCCSWGRGFLPPWHAANPHWQTLGRLNDWNLLVDWELRCKSFFCRTFCTSQLGHMYTTLSHIFIRTPLEGEWGCNGVLCKLCLISSYLSAPFWMYLMYTILWIDPNYFTHISMSDLTCIYLCLPKIGYLCSPHLINHPFFMFSLSTSP